MAIPCSSSRASRSATSLCSPTRSSSAAIRAAAPPVEPDPDGARLMMEYAADHATPSDAELSADESVSAFLDASRDAFVDWLSTMGSDPHAARPGVVGVRPSTPAPAAAAQAVAS